MWFPWSIAARSCTKAALTSSDGSRLSMSARLNLADMSMGVGAGVLRAWLAADSALLMTLAAIASRAPRIDGTILPTLSGSRAREDASVIMLCGHSLPVMVVVSVIAENEVTVAAFAVLSEVPIPGIEIDGLAIDTLGVVIVERRLDCPEAVREAAGEVLGAETIDVPFDIG